MDVNKNKSVSICWYSYWSGRWSGKLL